MDKCPSYNSALAADSRAKLLGQAPLRRVTLFRHRPVENVWESLGLLEEIAVVIGRTAVCTDVVRAFISALIRGQTFHIRVVNVAGIGLTEAS